MPVFFCPRKRKLETKKKFYHSIFSSFPSLFPLPFRYFRFLYIKKYLYFSFPNFRHESFYRSRGADREPSCVNRGSKPGRGEVFSARNPPQTSLAPSPGRFSDAELSAPKTARAFPNGPNASVRLFRSGFSSSFHFSRTAFPLARATKQKITWRAWRIVRFFYLYVLYYYTYAICPLIGETGDVYR